MLLVEVIKKHGYVGHVFIHVMLLWTFPGGCIYAPPPIAIGAQVGVYVDSYVLVGSLGDCKSMLSNSVALSINHIFRYKACSHKLGFRQN